jgi:hypothetical protein
MKYIFLFGHRQQHGKDTCCSILGDLLKEKNISHTRTFFAKLLKKQVAERYMLNFEKMDDAEYKKWKPPHLNKKIINSPDGPKEELRTVRQILIEEGCKGREIWDNTWAQAAYIELFKDNFDIGFLSDFRFPNEYTSINDTYSYFIREYKYIEKPKVVKVLVHRPNGIFNNDGADGHLPDESSTDFWDYKIYNDESSDWKQHLEQQVVSMLTKYEVI